jgi:hypothetical protein
LRIAKTNKDEIIKEYNAPLEPIKTNVIEIIIYVKIKYLTFNLLFFKITKITGKEETIYIENQERFQKKLLIDF